MPASAGPSESQTCSRAITVLALTAFPKYTPQHEAHFPITPCLQLSPSLFPGLSVEVQQDGGCYCCLGISFTDNCDPDLLGVLFSLPTLRFLEGSGLA